MAFAQARYSQNQTERKPQAFSGTARVMHEGIAAITQVTPKITLSAKESVEKSDLLMSFYGSFNTDDWVDQLLVEGSEPLTEEEQRVKAEAKAYLRGLLEYAGFRNGEAGCNLSVFRSKSTRDGHSFVNAKITSFALSQQVGDVDAQAEVAQA